MQRSAVLGNVVTPDRTSSETTLLHKETEVPGLGYRCTCSRAARASSPHCAARTASLLSSRNLA